MDHSADVGSAPSGSAPSGSAVVRHRYISIAKLAVNTDTLIDAWQQEKRGLPCDRNTNPGSMLRNIEAAGKSQFLLVKDVQRPGVGL